MTVLSAIVIGLLMGIVFGTALEKSRVFEPGVILGQMRLKNFLMLKVFLSAVATGAVVLGALYGADMIKLFPKPTLYAADVLGGLILGAGIALAGACPGTVLAQIGAGYRDAWCALLGGLTGAIVFGYAEPLLKPILLSGGPGKLTLATVTGLPYPALALGLAVLLVLGLVALEKRRSWKDEVGSNLDGMTKD